MDRLQSLLAFHEEDAGDSFVRFALALEYRKQGDNTRSADYFEGLVRDDPDYVGTYYHLGKLYLDLGRPDDALNTYRSGIKVAARIRDLHAKSELQSALMEAEMGD